MFFINPIGFLISPYKYWLTMSELPLSAYRGLMLYPTLMALLPAIAWYFGVTRIGWTVGDGAAVRLTSDSALTVVVLFYIAMLSSISVIGYLTHWMSKTYQAQTSLTKGIAVISLISTPLFFAGIVGIYPVLWLDLCVGMLALAWSLYLLYTGIPAVMKLPKEQGFLYASAVVGVAMVILICIMVGSVILWDFGFAPVFID